MKIVQISPMAPSCPPGTARILEFELPKAQGERAALGAARDAEMYVPPENRMVQIARRPCTFRYHDALELIDNGSVNGIFVNGQRVQRVEIHIGDHINVGGGIEFIVRE